MTSHSDWFELAGGWPPFEESAWPTSRPAVWQVEAADAEWILEAGRRARLAVLVELEQRFELILAGVRGFELGEPG